MNSDTWKPEGKAHFPDRLSAEKEVAGSWGKALRQSTELCVCVLGGLPR